MLCRAKPILDVFLTYKWWSSSCGGLTSRREFEHVPYHSKTSTGVGYRHYLDIGKGGLLQPSTELSSHERMPGMSDLPL